LTNTLSRSATRLLPGQRCARVIALCYLVSFTTLVCADPKLFDIPSQSLSRALLVFSSQANIQVVTAPGLALSGIAPAVHGRLEPATSLSALLLGSGLDYEFTSEESVVILLKPESASTPAHASDLDGSVRRTRKLLSTSDDEIPEIVVTAQRLEETIEQTPVTTAVVTSKELAEREFQNLKDLTYMVPSLTITSPIGDLAPKFTLRGIGSASYGQNTESTVPVYLDEFVLAPPNAQLDQAFDLDRIEVVEGPQGTLYGKNSTGGAINLITRKPTGQDSLSGTVTAGHFGELEGDVAAEYAINTQWSLRVACKREISDGYGFDTLTNRAIYGDDYQGGRATLRFAADGAEILVKIFAARTEPAYYIHTFGVNLDGSPRPYNSNPLTGYIAPANPYVGAYSPTSAMTRNLGTGINAKWVIGAVEIHSVSGYLDSNSTQNVDCDGSPYALCAAGPYDTYSRELSQEVRIQTGNKEGGRLIAGASYYRNSYEINNFYEIDSLFGTPSFFDLIREKDQSYAVFLDGSHPLGRALSLTAGLRVTRDDKVFSHQAPEFSLLGEPYDYHASASWTEPTYRAVLDYQMTRNEMLYASYSHGYRAGAFDSGLVTSVGQFHPVNPEFVNNFEAGFKGNFAERRIVVTADAFTAEYKDQQLLAVPPVAGAICCSLVNAGRSRIDGFEFDVKTLPTRNLSIRLSGSALNARYTQFNVGTSNYAGDKLANAPDYELYLMPEYRFPVSMGELFAATDVHRIGKSRVGTTIDLYGRAEQNPYTLTDARIGYRGKSLPLEIYAWAKNLQDRRYITDFANFSSLGYDEMFYGPPRTYGMTVRFSL
jgi:iron complex outermembrane recepter protein